MPETIAPNPPLTDRLPPHVWFPVSAVFHYLGPSFAVLLFARLAPAGIAWLRIASAGLVFALWRRPWRFLAALPRREQRTLLALGAVLALMNTVFYEAIARLPLATGGAIEFLGPIAVAAWGVQTWRNFGALLLAIAGVSVLTDVRLAGEILGYAFAFANCVLFVGYIVLGHRISAGGPGVSGVDGLAAAAGVGVSSSVIPYVCDQLAMRCLPRASFALLLSLLPVSAAGVGILVLRLVPGPAETIDILLAIGGIALHQAKQ